MPLQGVDLCQDRFHHMHGIGPGSFGEGQGDGCFLLAPVSAEENIVVRFLRSVENGGHFVQIDGSVAVDADHNPADFLGGGQKGAALQDDLVVQ